MPFQPGEIAAALVMGLVGFCITFYSVGIVLSIFSPEFSTLP